MIAHRPHPPLASYFEKAAVVSFCLFFIFPPPFQTFPHSVSFEFNCYSVGHAGSTPSVNLWSEGWPLPSLAHMLLTESNGHEFSPPFYFVTIPFFPLHLF
jgi:hypothetical protein